MMNYFPLAPRYRLDDESPWLEGIDPSRHYWVRINGDDRQITCIPGLVVNSIEEFKQTIRRFRAMQSGESMTLSRSASSCSVHCVSSNCYAIETDWNGATVWHLFDQETLDSLLMTSHPDWQCAQRDLELGRRMLLRSWQQPCAA